MEARTEAARRSAVAQIQPLFAHVDPAVIAMVWEHSAGRSVSRAVEQLLVMDGDEDASLRAGSAPASSSPATLTRQPPAYTSSDAVVLDPSVIVSVTPPGTNTATVIRDDGSFATAASDRKRAEPLRPTAARSHAGSPSSTPWRNKIPADFLRLPGMTEWLATQSSTSLTSTAYDFSSI